MALKLIFKFCRDDYTLSSKQENDDQIKQNLNHILSDKGITFSHMYRPSRNSVKVIFPTDSEIDKVMESEEEFKAKNFEPKMSLSLKACRTIFCTYFDQTLLQIYEKENIIDMLKQQKWKVKDVYIMKSKKSFKIEMCSRQEANRFLKIQSISIGGINITEDSIEPELDPTINQCWECGVLDPDHNTQNCTGRKICIKCGDTSHKFYECPIPKYVNYMNNQQKEARYCAACKSTASHTTLDHRACPKKRNILRERARVEREKRISKKESSNKEVELIRKAFNIYNEEWPLPQIGNQNPQQTKIAAIVTLALLDEASSPGVFDKKIQEACRNNGLPIINYKPEPNTAKDLQKIICGAHITNKINPLPKSNVTRYYSDSMRQKKYNQKTQKEQESIESISVNQDEPSEQESIDINSRKEKKTRIVKMNKAIQKGATALPQKQRKTECDRV